MKTPFQLIAEYDQFKRRYSKDAEGHEHDPANGQFTETGSGGEKKKSEKPPKGLTPHVDNVLQNIQATGNPHGSNPMPTAKQKAASAKAFEMGWIRSIKDPERPGIILGYELTEEGKAVVGKSKSEEKKSAGGFSDLLKQASANQAAANKRKRAGF